MVSKVYSCVGEKQPHEDYYIFFFSLFHKPSLNTYSLDCGQVILNLIHLSLEIMCHFKIMIILCLRLLCAFQQQQLATVKNLDFNHVCL